MSTIKPRRNLFKRECAEAGAKVSAALTRVLTLVRTRVPNAVLFFEPESCCIFVMDRDHPGYLDCKSARERQAAIVAEIHLNTEASFDAGAW